MDRQSIISNCFATGSAEGVNFVGGLIGFNGRVGFASISGGSICNCYSEVTVTGNGIQCGGLVSRNCGIIQNCYATGRVIGVNLSYGLAGISARNSFWDMETTGQDTSEGGIGFTTAQMKDPDIFGLHGWGGEVWTMHEGDYPRLAWENVRGDFIVDPIVTMEGSGTEVDPWQIDSAEDLIQVSLWGFFWDKHYV